MKLLRWLYPALFALTFNMPVAAWTLESNERHMGHLVFRIDPMDEQAKVLELTAYNRHGKPVAMQAISGLRVDYMVRDREVPLNMEDFSLNGNSITLKVPEEIKESFVLRIRIIQGRSTRSIQFLIPRSKTNS